MFTYEEHAEIKKLCRENEVIRKYVSELKEENENLLSHMTHEIGNSLALISGTIQLMNCKYEELSEYKYWNQLSDDINELTSLLQSYSAYNSCSRLNAGENNLLELLESVIKSSEAIRKKKQVELCVNKLEYPMPYLEAYSCDGVKIRQVFVNVIKNAIEATERGGYIHIQIPEMVEEIEKNGQKKEYMRFVIVNSIEQIDEDDLKNIFKPYTSTKSIGRGLGMPIAYRIMDVHGGTIEIQLKEKEVEIHILFPVIR